MRTTAGVSLVAVSVAVCAALGTLSGCAFYGDPERAAIVVTNDCDVAVNVAVGAGYDPTDRASSSRTVDAGESITESAISSVAMWFVAIYATEEGTKVVPVESGAEGEDATFAISGSNCHE